MVCEPQMQKNQLIFVAIFGRASSIPVPSSPFPIEQKICPFLLCTADRRRRELDDDDVMQRSLLLFSFQMMPPAAEE